jgi:hypothetical protein
VKSLEQAVEPFYLELDTHLDELEATRGWQLVREALTNERTLALEIALNDREMPRRYYQGYIKAVEYLLELPTRIREGAQQIREEQDAEDNLEATKSLVARQYEGGGEIA